MGVTSNIKKIFFFIFLSGCTKKMPSMVDICLDFKDHQPSSMRLWIDGVFWQSTSSCISLKPFEKEFLLEIYQEEVKDYYMPPFKKKYELPFTYSLFAQKYQISVPLTLYSLEDFKEEENKKEIFLEEEKNKLEKTFVIEEDLNEEEIDKEEKVFVSQEKDENKKIDSSFISSIGLISKGSSQNREISSSSVVESSLSFTMSSSSVKQNSSVKSKKVKKKSSEVFVQVLLEGKAARGASLYRLRSQSQLLDFWGETNEEGGFHDEANIAGRYDGLWVVHSCCRSQYFPLKNSLESLNQEVNLEYENIKSYFLGFFSYGMWYGIKNIDILNKDLIIEKTQSGGFFQLLLDTPWTGFRNENYIFEDIKDAKNNRFIMAGNLNQPRLKLGFLSRGNSQDWFEKKIENDLHSRLMVSPFLTLIVPHLVDDFLEKEEKNIQEILEKGWDDSERKYEFDFLTVLDWEKKKLYLQDRLGKKLYAWPLSLEGQKHDEISALQFLKILKCLPFEFDVIAHSSKSTKIKTDKDFSNIITKGDVFEVFKYKEENFLPSLESKGKVELQKMSENEMEFDLSSFKGLLKLKKVCF